MGIEFDNEWEPGELSPTERIRAAWDAIAARRQDAIEELPSDQESKIHRLRPGKERGSR